MSMTEEEFEEVLGIALKEFAKFGDLPIEVKTVKEAELGEEAGLLVTVGDSEFHVQITQTV